MIGFPRAGMTRSTSSPRVPLELPPADPEPDTLIEPRLQDAPVRELLALQAELQAALDARRPPGDGSNPPPPAPAVPAEEADDDTLVAASSPLPALSEVHERALPRKAPPAGPAEAGEPSPTEKARPRPRVRRLRPRRTGSIAPEGLDGLVRTVAALARTLPTVLMMMVFAFTLAAFVGLLGGRGASTPHVELTLLVPPGHPQGRGGPSRILLHTEPAGVLVFHGRRLLGTTPCEAQLPYRPTASTGVRLSGPRFEEWVGTVEARDDGVYRVAARLVPR